MKSSLLRCIAVFALMGTLSFVLVPAPAMAGGQTLKRSVGNITQWPLDMILSPITGGRRLFVNMRKEKDPLAVKVLFFLPGFIFLTGTNIFGGTMRAFAGVAELPPGLVLIFMKDSEMYPLFPITERGWAIVDADTPVFHFKFGIDYAGGNVQQKGGDPATGF